MTTTKVLFYLLMMRKIIPMLNGSRGPQASTMWCAIHHITLFTLEMLPVLLARSLLLMSRTLPAMLIDAIMELLQESDIRTFRITRSTSNMQLRISSDTMAYYSSQKASDLKQHIMGARTSKQQLPISDEPLQRQLRPGTNNASKNNVSLTRLFGMKNKT